MTNSRLITIEVLDGGDEEEFREESGITVAQVRRKMNVPDNYLVEVNGRAAIDTTVLTADSTVQFVPPRKDKAA